jgi:predicted nucleic acid-binding protein
MAVASYLADTSVLSRLSKPTVHQRIEPLITDGLVAVCPMVEMEVLYSARAPGEYRAFHGYLSGFERLPMPDEVWDTAFGVQAVLAASSKHRCAKLPDLLIAATAARHQVTVLHYDKDYDAIAAVTDQAVEWVVPAGTAD